MADEIAYRDLRRGEVIQPGDEWQTELGRWEFFHQSMIGRTIDDVRARRRYNITKLKQELALARGIAKHWEHVAEQMEAQRDEAQAELARLQQSPAAADHFVDAGKMVETELERKAWQLYSRLDLDESGAFDQAQFFLAERDRRRALGGHDANSL